MLNIFDYASLPEVAYPAGFFPVKTLEDEIYYLEHILPRSDQKENLSQQATGLSSKERIRSLALSISTIAMKMMCWKSAIPYTQTIGSEVVCQAARALRYLAFLDLGLLKRLN